jgi:hypothetical protein
MNNNGYTPVTNPVVTNGAGEIGAGKIVDTTCTIQGKMEVVGQTYPQNEESYGDESEPM